MSDHRHKNGTGKSALFSELSTKELEMLIGDAFFEDEIDVELLEGLLDIYNNRSDVPAVDVDAAWERFNRDYAGSDEIYLTEDADNATQTNHNEERARPHRRKRALRYSSIAAALILITVAISSLTTPAGANIWNAIANWTNGTFWFGDQNTNKQISVELESLHETLADNGVTDQIAPTWLPEEYTLFDLSVLSLTDRTLFIAHFRANTLDLIIQIIMRSDQFFHSYERDENEAELYRRNGVDHHIVSNIGKTNVLWATSNYECIIGGDISVDEAKQMINSIYER